jgi:nucleotide-binding universal stress UspA family protein
MEPEAAIVLGWDGHRPSTSALRYSIELARRLRAHIHVVHVIDLDDTPIDPDSADWEQQLGVALADEAAEARRLLDGLAASWTYHGGHGDPADLLARVADEYSALMVVIGSPRGGLISVLDTVFGQSVAHRLIGIRKTPLLIVPADPAS